jgi:BatD DUF11 like domain
MKKVAIRNILCLTGIIFFLVSNYAFPVTSPEISATLNRDRIPLGETAVLTVAVNWEGEASEFLFSKPPQPPACRGLAVTGTSQRGITYRAANGTTHQSIEFIFSLRGENAGAGKIGTVSLSYHRQKEETKLSLSSKPMEVTVTAGGEGIFSSFRSALIYIGIGLAAVIIIAFYIIFTIRRYKKKSNEVISDYVENLEDDSLKELDHVRKYKVRGEIDEYLEKIWDILARYLEKKYTITISPDTWNEVLGGKRASGISEESELELSRILKSLEESRFGSYQADSQELDDLLKRVYSFIESQKNHSAD